MKKYLPHILAVIVVIGIFGFFGAHRAEAGFFDSFLDLKQLFADGSYIILTIISKLVALAGYFSDYAIKYSINNINKESLEVVNEGWALSRDVANLFFIFILLYIAIATILQLSGYGMKELLVTVIILALLVNFSLVITKFIIDGSNILAMEFYNKLSNIEYKGGGVSPSGTSKPSLSEALVAGINPQTLFNINSATAESKKKVGAGNIFTNSQDATLIQITLICLFGSALLIVLAFVLFAAGALFAIRTAILWILMIFAPLAFLFMALPATSGYAKQWWKKLFEQSFFAPTYLFLFYFVVKIVSSGSILKGLKGSNSVLSSSFGSPDSANVALIFNFAILIVLSVASLVVAKQMGAVGASTVQGWGQSAKKWGQGYAGKMSRRGAGWAAEKTLDRENKWGGSVGAWIGKIPFASRGLAQASSWKKAEDAKQKKGWEKQYGGYSDSALKAMISDRTLVGGAKRNVINDILAKRAAGGYSVKDKERLDEINKELEKNNKVIPGGTQTFEEFYKSQAIEMEATLTGMSPDTSPDGIKKRIEVLSKKKRAEGKLKEIENMKKEKEKIEEKKERKGELGELEQKLGGKIDASKKT
jgi:hypothetical protein